MAATLTGWTSGQTSVTVLFCYKVRLTTLVFLPSIYIIILLISLSRGYVVYSRSIERREN